MATVGTMVQRIHALANTKDVNDATNKFIHDMWRSTDGGKRTSHLTEKQLSWIEDIFNRHYGD